MSRQPCNLVQRIFFHGQAHLIPRWSSVPVCRRTAEELVRFQSYDGTTTGKVPGPQQWIQPEHWTLVPSLGSWARPRWGEVPQIYQLTWRRGNKVKTRAEVKRRRYVKHQLRLILVIPFDESATGEYFLFRFGWWRHKTQIAFSSQRRPGNRRLKSRNSWSAKVWPNKNKTPKAKQH